MEKQKLWFQIRSQQLHLSSPCWLQPHLYLQVSPVSCAHLQTAAVTEAALMSHLITMETLKLIWTFPICQTLYDRHSFPSFFTLILVLLEVSSYFKGVFLVKVQVSGWKIPPGSWVSSYPPLGRAVIPSPALLTWSWHANAKLPITFKPWKLGLKPDFPSLQLLGRAAARLCSSCGNDSRPAGDSFWTFPHKVSCGSGDPVTPH